MQQTNRKVKQHINRKNQRLIDQYPFLQPVLSGLGTKWLHFHQDKVSKLDIRVERADKDLMWRYATCFGLSDGPNTQYRVVDSGKRDGLLMRQHEYLVSVDGSGHAYHHFFWSDYYVPNKFLHFVHDCMFDDVRFYENGDRGHLGTCVAHKILNLLWIRCQSFHKASGNESLPFGDLVDVDVSITVYNKPKNGGFDTLCYSDIFEHFITHENILQTGLYAGNPKFLMMQGMLAEMCQNLVDNVWNKGFKQVFIGDKNETRYKEFRLNDIVVTCNMLSGTLAITIEDKSGNMIVLMSREDKDGDYTGFFVHKHRGKLPSIRRMVYAVIDRHRK